MARTEGVYVAENSVTEIPDGGSVRVEVFNTTQNHATDTPLYTWPVSVQSGRFVIDIPQTTSNQYPDNIKLSIVATLSTGESVRKLIAGANGGTLLQRKGSVQVPVFLNDDAEVFISPDIWLRWSGPPGFYYKIQVFSDAARTTLATDNAGNDLTAETSGSSYTFNSVPENGATLYARLLSWPDITKTGTGLISDITVVASDGKPLFAEFGGILTGPVHTFTVLNGKAGWRYDLRFNDTDTTNSVLWPVDTITRGDLPVDGNVYPLTIAYWPDGDNSNIQYSYGSVTAYNSDAVPDKSTQLILPDTDVPEGSYDLTDWETAISPLDSTYWEAGGTPITSVETVDGRRALCVRLDSTESPSTRMNAGADLAPSQELIIEQHLRFSDDFVWGGTDKGGKVGFGSGGGSRKSGGLAGPDDPDTQSGYTARLMWRATTEDDGQMYAYLYHANTVGYGDDHGTGFYPLRGQWFKHKTRIVMNSAAGVADGTYEVWINDVQRLDLTGIEWFGTGTPQVDTLLTSNFHGGTNVGDQNWSPPPGQINYVCMAGVFWSDEDAPALIENVTQNMAATYTDSLRVKWDITPAAGAQLRWRVKDSGSAYTYGYLETVAYSSHDYTVAPLVAGTTYEVIINSGGVEYALDATTASVVTAPPITGPTKSIVSITPNVDPIPTALRNQFGYQAQLGSSTITIPAATSAESDIVFTYPSTYTSETGVTTLAQFNTAWAACPDGGAVRLDAVINGMSIPAGSGGSSATTAGRKYIIGGGETVAASTGGYSYCRANNVVFANQKVGCIWIVSNSNAAFYHCYFTGGYIRNIVETGPGSLQMMALGCRFDPAGSDSPAWHDMLPTVTSLDKPEPLDTICAYCDFENYSVYKAPYLGVGSFQNYPNGHTHARMRHYRNYYRDSTDEILTIKSPNHWVDYCLIDQGGRLGNISMRESWDTMVTRSIFVNHSNAALQINGFRNHCHYNQVLMRGDVQATTIILTRVPSGDKNNPDSSVHLVSPNWISAYPMAHCQIKYNIFGSLNPANPVRQLIRWDWFTPDQADNYLSGFPDYDYVEGNEITDNAILNVGGISIKFAHPEYISAATWAADNPLTPIDAENEMVPSGGTWTKSGDPLVWPTSVTIPAIWNGEDVVVDMPSHWLDGSAAVIVES